MKEIEVKAKIADIKSLNEKLAGLGCKFSGPFMQEDIIFLPVGIGFSDIVKGTPVVRVRSSNNIITLTLKKRVINGEELIKLEREIIVNDKQKTLEIVEHMGFHEVVRVSKKRIECDYKGMVICLDDVAELGSFIEIEKLSENENNETVQDHLFSFLQSLGVGNDDRVTKGYDTLIYEKNNLK